MEEAPIVQIQTTAPATLDHCAVPCVVATPMIDVEIQNLHCRRTSRFGPALETLRVVVVEATPHASHHVTDGRAGICGFTAWIAHECHAARWSQLIHVAEEENIYAAEASGKMTPLLQVSVPAVVSVTVLHRDTV